MIAMLPTAITVAELPVEPDALQAFALEQNRLGMRAVGATGDAAAPDCPGEPRPIRRLFRAAGGSGGLFDATTALPVPPEPAEGPVAGHTRKGASGPAEGPAAHAH